MLLCHFLLENFIANKLFGVKMGVFVIVCCTAFLAVTLALL